MEQKLTVREEQVLSLMWDGLSNPEIAEILSIRTATVKAHVHAILSKTGAAGRIDACRWGLQRGVLSA